MRKNVFLAAIAVGALITSCNSESLFGGADLQGNSDGRISFTKKDKNMTRAANRAEAVNHYEFGVFGAYEDIYDPTGENNIFNNYLVSYKNDKHYTGANGGQTYLPDEENGTNNTVAANGLSTWFYEGLTVAGSKAYQDQILKYWDYSTTTSKFVAYGPYQDDFKYTLAASKVGFEWSNVGTLYQNSVIKGTDIHGTTHWQPVGTVKSLSTTQNPITNNASDEELTNSNEVIYTDVATVHPKASYNTDVPLNFIHGNAKINIKFYEVIDGYSVQILDLIPDGTKIGGSPTGTFYDGIAFTPAIKAEADNQNDQNKDDGWYYDHTKFSIADVLGTEVVTIGNSADTKADLVNDELRFLEPTATAIGTTQGTATPSATAYVALPNHNGTDYTTLASTAVQGIVSNTGYTLHVTYKLIPDDGSKSLIVYDARCYVPAAECKWKPNTNYTYIFKITNQTNGTTDPTDLDKDIFSTSSTEPYIDPTDPRIPEDPALKPIVFDGVMVSEYVDNAGATENNDHLISDPTTWTTFGDKKISQYPLTTTEFTEVLGNYYHANLTSVSVASDGFNLAARTFTVKNGSATTDVNALTQAEVPLAKSSMDVSGIPAAASTTWAAVIAAEPNIKAKSYTIALWENDGATSATTYTATPDVSSVVVTAVPDDKITSYAYKATLTKTQYDALTRAYIKGNYAVSEYAQIAADNIDATAYGALSTDDQAAYESDGGTGYNLKATIAKSVYDALSTTVKAKFAVSQYAKVGTPADITPEAYASLGAADKDAFTATHTTTYTFTYGTPTYTVGSAVPGATVDRAYGVTKK